LLGSIDLSNEKWWIIFSKDFGGSCIFRGKRFAMSAPWGIEFNEKELVVLKLFIEIVIGEYKDSLILFNSGEDALNDS